MDSSSRLYKGQEHEVGFIGRTHTYLCLLPICPLHFVLDGAGIRYSLGEYREKAAVIVNIVNRWFFRFFAWSLFNRDRYGMKRSEMILQREGER